MGKRFVLNAVKTVAVIAAVVFWFCPLSSATQVLIFVGSIVVLLICFGISNGLDDSNTGYWPPRPSLSNSRQELKDTIAKEGDPRPPSL
jgi:hypothetical protein